MSKKKLCRRKMSAGTVPSSSNSDGTPPQTGTETIDTSAYVYTLPETERISVCYYLDQNNVWEEAARQMGYESNDIIVSSSHHNSNHI